MTNYPSYTALNNSNFANYTQLNNCNYVRHTSLTNSNYVPFNALASCNYIINSVNNLTNYSTTSTLSNIFTTSNVLSNTSNILNTAINTKENILTFSSPIIRTINIISLNQSLISYNNLADRPNLNLYVLKAGDTMTGNLNINLANPVITISGTNEGDRTTLFLGTPHQNTGAYKTAIIAEGMNNWSRSRLHFCLNNVDDNTRPSQNAGTNNIRMTILPNGNVGIGNSRPDQLLDVNGSAIIRGTLTSTSTNASTFNFVNISHSTGRITHIPFSDNTIYLRAPVRIDFDGLYVALASTFNSSIGVGDKISATRYECVGVLFSYSTLTNSGGQSRDGYFIPMPINNYGNSIILCAFSHDSTQYTYWRGHISVGNSNNILNVSSPISGSQLLVESFIQNTGTHFIRVVPIVSYNTGVQLRAKMYG